MAVEYKRPTIMLVDDNQANLNIGKNLLKAYYEVYALPSAERLFRFLESIKPNLILLDVMMPGMSGFDVIKILKADMRYADIPVIFVTARLDGMGEEEGLALGAVDYVTKPYVAAVMLKRIEKQLLIERQTTELKKYNNNLIEMVKEKTEQLSRLQNSIISTMAELVEFRDNYTGLHIARTQRYMELLINCLIEYNIYPQEVLMWENSEDIVPASQLHDIGKIFISDAILNKPGRLTSEEYEVMKTHVTKGVKAIEQLDKKEVPSSFVHYAKVIATAHHEKWDGSGYPHGLKGTNIPLLGRLMAVADVYDALTSVRSYKKQLSQEEASKIIYESAGTHFDPVLVDIYKKVAYEFAAVPQDMKA